QKRFDLLDGQSPGAAQHGRHDDGQRQNRRPCPADRGRRRRQIDIAERDDRSREVAVGPWQRRAGLGPLLFPHMSAFFGSTLGPKPAWLNQRERRSWVLGRPWMLVHT